jgi:hypothetical protein
LTEDQQEVRDTRAAAGRARHGDDQILHEQAHGQSLHETERDSQGERDLTEAEYLQRYRDSIHNNVLPELPKIPGYHTFWATTTNPRDSVQRRLQMGYSFVKAEDFPGWESNSVKTGDYAGVIGLNEMVALKLPESLYQLYMRESHHHAPMAEEEKLRATVQGHQESAARQRGKVLDEDGYLDNVVQKAPPPRFAA